jgi:RNA polymerase sigma factor (sigma-70 family)
MKRGEITQSSFDAMMEWLDHDREQAGARYELIRRVLIRIFVCRGCSDAEDLADLTINRVIVKAEELVKTYEGDPALYFYGVAQKVVLESLRRKPPPSNNPPPSNGPEDDEQDYDCLDRCMDDLADEDRKLVRRYYEEEKSAKIDNRRVIATELGISVNALRIRVHRLRTQLQACMRSCLEATQAH